MQRNLSIDVLKIGLAIIVIALHAVFLSDMNQALSYLLVDGVFRIAVPIFFVINGYYFTRVLSEPSAWFKRGFILYLVWMLIYSYYWLHVPDLGLLAIAKMIKTLLIGYGHLWYIASMLGAGIVLYFLRKLPSRTLLIVALSLYILGATIQYLGNYHLLKSLLLDKLINIFWIYRNPLLFAFPFFCIGHLIEKHQIHKKIKPIYILLGTVIGLMLLIGESYMNFHSTTKPEEFDILFSLLLICPLVFILFLGFDLRGNSKNIALYSTSIYLVHYLVMLQLKEFTRLNSVMLTLATILISITISIALVKLNQKAKYLL